MNRTDIARVCHEVNRAYCEALGDHSQPAWENAPAWQQDSARLGVALHSAHDVGPQASHESWMTQKIRDGWVYGITKDPEAKTHPCIVAFEDLPREQQAKDFIFRAVVHALRDLVVTHDTWVALTDDDVDSILDFAYDSDLELVRTIETKLRESNFER